MDLRLRVLADCDAGLTTTVVARKFSVSPAWVRRLKQRRASGGGIAPTHCRPGPKPVLAHGAAADRLRQLATAQPDLSAREYRDRLGLDCHPTTVWRALRRLGLTFKKR
jgi:transposase